MNVQQLAAIFEDIANTDLDQMRCDPMLVWLEEAIQRHTGVDRVVLRSALIDPGEVQPSADDRVFGGTTVHRDDNEAPKVRDLRLFGNPPVLGDLRAVTHTLIIGPKDDPLAPLATGQRCMLMRVRLKRDLCWAMIVSDARFDDKQEVSRWLAAMPTLLRIPFQQRLDPVDPKTVRGRRHLFYQKLLDYVPTKPDDDFKQICRAWQQVSDADWAWLWLYNPNSSQFELTAFTAKDPDDEQQRRVLPDVRTAPGENSIAMYCSLNCKAAFVDDPQHWRATLDGRVYEVTTKACLDKLGCKAFDCAPLLLPTKPEQEAVPTVGVVSLHWREVRRRVPHAQEAFVNMGRLTALFVRNSKMSEQRAILVELNRMAQRHLTRISRHPHQVREEYLGDLIELLKKRLHVGAASVFYRTRFDNAVQCIGTTGLCTSDGQPVPPDELSNAVYKAGEGLTGRCFATATPIMPLRPRREVGYAGKFLEMRSVNPTDETDPLLLFPILTAADFDGKKVALGVIRCAEHLSPMFPGGLCLFDPTEEETLGFIAEQVGPVLQTFEQRIDRERAVSVVKHDLSAPLVMIRDTVQGIIRAVEQREEIGGHALKDIEVCSTLAISLAAQLDPDPRQARRLNQRPTLLEGDIVARLRDMLSHFAWKQKRMRIRFDGFRDIPALLIDPEQIERVMNNLLVNAIKYGEPRSTIEVKALRTASDYVVNVSNHGMGIEFDEERCLFAPYYRSPRADRWSTQGVGLGLSIAQQIMKAHGAELRLTSRKNPTVFSLFFPKALAIRD